MGFFQFGLYYALWNLIYVVFGAFCRAVRESYKEAREKQNGNQ